MTSSDITYEEDDNGYTVYRKSDPQTVEYGPTKREALDALIRRERDEHSVPAEPTQPMQATRDTAEHSQAPDVLEVFREYYAKDERVMAVLACPRIIEVAKSMDMLGRIIATFFSITGDPDGYREGPVNTLNTYENGLKELRAIIGRFDAVGNLCSNGDLIDLLKFSADAVEREINIARPYLDALPLRPEHFRRSAPTPPERKKATAICRALGEIIGKDINNRYQLIDELMNAAGVSVIKNWARSILNK